MRFLTVLLPWDQGSVFLWVLTIWAVGCVFGVLLWTRTRKIVVCVRSASQRIPSGEGNTDLPEHLFQAGKGRGRFDPSRSLSKRWEEYQRTFLPALQRGEQPFSLAPAEEFFGAESVLPDLLNVRFWRSVPNIALGLGILGTFVGLVWGLEGFDTSEDRIISSIEQLLVGINTAFVTSIWGMIVSLVFGAVEKWRFHAVDQELSNLCSALDKQFFCPPMEVVRGLVVFEHEGKVVLPRDALRTLVLESEEQTKALKAFSTDLAEGIKLSTETIDAIGDKLREIIDQSLEERVREYIDELGDRIDRVVTTPAGELIEEAINNLSNNISNLFSNFSEDVFNSMKESINELASKLDSSGNQFENFSKGMDDLIKNLQESIGTVGNEFGEISSDLRLDVNQWREQQDALLKRMEEMLQGAESFVRQVQEASEGLTEAGQAADELVQQMVALAGPLKEGTERLEASVRFLEDAMRSHERVVQSVLQGLQEALSQTESLSEEYSTIGEGLQGIFDEIRDGLIAYQGAVKASINELLGEFSTTIQRSVGSLSAMVQGFEEVLEELEELLRNLRS